MCVCVFPKPWVPHFKCVFLSSNTNDEINGWLFSALGLSVACLWVMLCACLNMSQWTFAYQCLALPVLATVKKSIRLREEALAKEPVKATNSQTSAEKLRKILKEEKR